MRTRLDSVHRVGRFARDLVWSRQVSMIRGSWLPFLLILLLCQLAAAGELVIVRGAASWFIAGALSLSGLWIIALVLVTAGGVTSRMMSIQAEMWTSQAIRRHRKQGWRLANGLQLRGDADVDHLVVAPIGVLVIECKWSAEPWDRVEPFMAERIDRAIDQAATNRAEVERQFKAALEGITPRAVCVLWSPEGEPRQDVGTTDGVAIVGGSEFADWLRSLAPVLRDKDAVDRIWDAVERRARSRDSYDERKAIKHTPALVPALVQVLLVPMVTCLAALLIASESMRLIDDWRFDLLALLGMVVVGLILTRFSVTRRVGLAWLAPTSLLFASLSFWAFATRV